MLLSQIHVQDHLLPDIETMHDCFEFNDEPLDSLLGMDEFTLTH